jgi:hypothetical protein
MVNSGATALEFISPSVINISSFSGTLTSSFLIDGTNTNAMEIRHAHATTGSTIVEFYTAQEVGMAAYTSTTWSGNYAAMYVGQQYANIAVEFSPNVKQVLINATAMLVTDSEDSTGLQYAADYSTAGKSLGARWIPDWGAFSTHIAGNTAHTTVQAPGLSEDGMVIYWDNNNVRWDLKTITGGANHALLSATHTDTLAASVVRGDIIVGNSTPAWSRLAISGTSNHVLRTNGTDVYWGALNYTDLTGSPPAGIAFGNTDQIPHMNAGTPGTDFDYSSSFTFSSTNGLYVNYVGIGVAASSSYALRTSHASTAGWFERAFSGTPAAGTPYAAMALQFTTTASNIDTGPFFYFKYEDSSAVVQNIAAFGAMRDGADNSGKIMFYTYNAGSRTLRMEIGSTGSYSFWNNADVSERFNIAMNVDGQASLYHYDTSPAGYKIVKIGTNVAAKGLEVNGDTGNVGINVANDSLYALKVSGYIHSDRYYITSEPADTVGEGITAAVDVDINTNGIGDALCCYTDGHYESADADSMTRMPVVALALNATAGNPRQVLLMGYLKDASFSFSGAGALVYASTALGQLTTTPPSGTGDIVQVVGVATSTTSLFFNPSLSMVEIV